MRQNFAKDMIFVTIILMDLLSGTEFYLFVPSFPNIQKVFYLSPFWVEALLSVNFAGYCLSLFFVGALADRYGRKPIILFELVTFIIGSILCAMNCEISKKSFMINKFQFIHATMAFIITLHQLIIKKFSIDTFYRK